MKNLEMEARQLLSHFERVTEHLARADRTAEITRSEVALFTILGPDGGLTMGEVAARLRVAFSSATGIVDRFVKKGYAKRKHAKEDRRSVIVSLTQRGRHAHTALAAERLELASGMLRRLGPGGSDHLARAF